MKPKMYNKSRKMRPGALRAASGAPVGSRNVFWDQPVISILQLFAELVRFWSLFWAHVVPEGVPKSSSIKSIKKYPKVRSRRGLGKNMNF